MKFIIERKMLLKMLRQVSAKPPHQKTPDPEVRLYACCARVFVEANETVSGVEALVLEDGGCVLQSKPLMMLLKNYPEKIHLTFEAAPHFLRFAGSTMNIQSYTRAVQPPDRFQVFAVTDAWVASGTRQETADAKPRF